MNNRIQRTTDNKFLVLFEEDTWTDDINQAKEFKIAEMMFTLMKLNKKYKPQEIRKV